MLVEAGVRRGNVIRAALERLALGRAALLELRGSDCGLLEFIDDNGVASHDVAGQSVAHPCGEMVLYRVAPLQHGAIVREDAAS